MKYFLRFATFVAIIATTFAVQTKDLIGQERPTVTWLLQDDAVGGASARFTMQKLLTTFKNAMVGVNRAIQNAEKELETLLKETPLVTEVHGIWAKAQTQALAAVNDVLGKLFSTPPKELPKKISDMFAKLRQISVTAFSEIRFVLIEGGYEDMLVQVETIYDKLIIEFETALAPVLELINGED